MFACREEGQLRGYIALKIRTDARGHFPGHYVVTDLFYELRRKDVLYSLMNYAYEYAKGQGCSIFQVSGFSREVIDELKTQRPYIRKSKACPYWYTSLHTAEALLCNEKHWWPAGVDGDSYL